jgi:hypothetical protein
MADVPRALLRQLVRLSAADRLCLCVLWSYVTAREAEAARKGGSAPTLRRYRAALAADLGEDVRSIRRHLARLEAAGAIARADDDATITLLGADDVRIPEDPTEDRAEDPADPGPTGPGEDPPVPLTDGSGGRTDESPGPTSPPDPPVREGRTERSGEGGPTSPPPPDRAVPLIPLATAPGEQTPGIDPLASSKLPTPPPARVRAHRPAELPDRHPPRLDAQAILDELAKHPHPRGVAPIWPDRGGRYHLDLLLADPAVNDRHVLEVSLAYLRILTAGRPIEWAGKREPQDAKRWWTAKLWSTLPGKGGHAPWTVVGRIVAAAQAEDDERRAAERREAERREAERAERIRDRIAGAEASSAAPIEPSDNPYLDRVREQLRASADETLDRLRAARETAAGRQLTTEEMEAALGLTPAERNTGT